MRIGVPKEIKNHEYRVGLSPNSVRELVAIGHTVLDSEMARASALASRIKNTLRLAHKSCRRQAGFSRTRNS